MRNEIPTLASLRPPRPAPWIADPLLVRAFGCLRHGAPPEPPVLAPGSSPGSASPDEEAGAPQR